MRQRQSRRFKWIAATAGMNFVMAWLPYVCVASDISTSATPPPATLPGRCVDESGQPIDKVSVTLWRADLTLARGIIVAKTLTDRTGRFEFKDVPYLDWTRGPQYLIVADAPGCCFVFTPYFPTKHKLVEELSPLKLS